MNRNQFLIIIISWCFASILAVHSVYAQDMAPRIAVYPHTFDMQVLPGELIEQKIKIFNQSEFPIPMTTRIVDFTAEDISGQMLFTEILQDPSLASRLWFTVENPDFILDPGETEKVEFQIRIPKSAEPGGYYAVMIFEPRFPSFYFEEESIVRNIPEIGVLFLTSIQKFTLEPESKQKLEVAEFYLSEEKRLVGLENFISRLMGTVALAVDINIVRDSYLNFILQIKNNDIYHIKPSGTISIYNFFGKRVGEIEIAQKTILPGKVRIFPAEFKPEVPEKLKWLPASIANFLVKNSLFGKYQVKLELQAKSPVTTELFYLIPPATLTFFSLSWKFWGPVILIFSAIILFSLKYRERIKTAAKILFTRKPSQ